MFDYKTSYWPQPESVYTQNKKIAVEPFVDTYIKTSQEGRGAIKVLKIENKVSLVALKVVFPTEDRRFSRGMSVMVRGDLFTQPWAKEKHTVDGQEFILLPETHVEVVLDPSAVTSVPQVLTFPQITFGDTDSTGSKPE